MRIDKVTNGFDNGINIGRYTLFVITDKNGVVIDNKEIANQAAYYSYITIKGKDNPYNQREDLRGLAKAIEKENQDTEISIQSDGLVKPLPMPLNCKDIINIKLKSSGIDYAERVNANVISNFIQGKSYFCFEAKSDEDVDEIEMIIKDLGIPKGRVFINPFNHKMLDKIKTLGYNISFKI